MLGWITEDQLQTRLCNKPTIPLNESKGVAQPAGDYENLLFSPIDLAERYHFFGNAFDICPKELYSMPVRRALVSLHSVQGRLA